MTTEHAFSRTELLLGAEAIQRLQASHVTVFGVGGVGGYVAEALARSGVGAIDLIDPDKVTITNLNRQIYALHSTIGQLKVDVAEERILDINPECVIRKFPLFYLPENADQVPLADNDYVIDCIDTITAKIELIRRCHELNIPLICSMGSANKLNPMGFRVADINETNIDPLARIIRKKLRKLNIPHLKVVYSEESPVIQHSLEEQNRPVPASVAFVPAAAGLLIAAEVVRELTFEL